MFLYSSSPFAFLKSNGRAKSQNQCARKAMAVLAFDLTHETNNTKIKASANHNKGISYLNQSKFFDRCILFEECSLTHESIQASGAILHLLGGRGVQLRSLRFCFFTMAAESSYLTELLAEKDNLDPSFVHSMRLLTEGKWWKLCNNHKVCFNISARLHSFEVKNHQLLVQVWSDFLLLSIILCLILKEVVINTSQDIRDAYISICKPILMLQPLSKSDTIQIPFDRQICWCYGEALRYLHFIVSIIIDYVSVL